MSRNSGSGLGFWDKGLRCRDEALGIRVWAGGMDLPKTGGDHGFRAREV